MSARRRIGRRVAGNLPPPPPGFTQFQLDDSPEGVAEQLAIEDLSMSLIKGCEETIGDMVDLRQLTEEQRKRCMRIFVAGMRVSLLGALLMNWDGAMAGASIKATLPGMIDAARRNVTVARRKVGPS